MPCEKDMRIFNMHNDSNVSITKKKGVFSVMEHRTDLSQNDPSQAMMHFYMQHQGIHKRQLAINLSNQGVILQNGAMQWMAGDVKSTTDVKGIGDLFGKAIKGKITGESAINPLYKGTGMIICEPTYKHLILEEISDHGGLAVADGIFLACEDTVELKISTVKTFSGAVAGNMGIFNLLLKGVGVAALECPLPEEEIIRVDLSQGEEIRVDGPYAIMWDENLVMSVERSSKTLLGSAVSGEGLVNVYRGVGSVWLTTASANVK
ncbi:MAG: AIM24 family protein [Clostridiales bacterium]|jgi:uncharacterized protein (AIM24 family)|nr:AIM24 family protein [Clostridiales bacterium]